MIICTRLIQVSFLSEELFSCHLSSSSFFSSHICLDKKEPDVDLSRGLPTDDQTSIPSRSNIDPSIASGTLMSQISGIQSNLNVTVANPVPELGVETIHRDELSSLLSRIDEWGLDTFRIEELSGQRPLTVITYKIFKQRLLDQTYSIDDRTLISYLLTLEDHYQQVPYHNKAHGADVCQSMHVLLNASALEVRFPLFFSYSLFILPVVMLFLSIECFYRLRNHVSHLCFGCT